MNDLKWTGERLVTSISVHGTIEHLHRYALAQEIAKDKVVLDIASGEGYGSFLLSKVAKQVFGVDVDQESIAHAEIKYGQKDTLSFLHGSTSKIPLPDHSVDVVISFETIEHHDEHDQMMVEITRVLKSDGCLLISSPEKSIYKQRDPVNPYHIKELTLDAFEHLLSKYFKSTHIFTQRFVIGSLIHSTEAGLHAAFKMYDGDYSTIYEGLTEDNFYNKPYFNMAICSNVEISNFKLPYTSLFNGVRVVTNEVDVEIKRLKIENANLQNSHSYKIGNWYMRKLSFFTKFLKPKTK